MKPATPDAQYENLMHTILTKGVLKSDRTGTGTTSIFGHQMRYDLSAGFPLVTTKKVFLKAVIVELLWFLRGDTNVKWLQENGCNIWNEWAREDGSLGPVYGAQWRSWRGAGESYTESDKLNVTTTIDQISQVIDLLKTNPDSRRILVSAWNVSELDKMALMPCHVMFQFYSRLLSVSEREEVWSSGWSLSHLEGMTDTERTAVFDYHSIPTRRLDLQLYQRSADVFLGVPFNIASYSLLMSMVAQQVNMVPGDFIWTGGDCHLYDNHEEQVAEQLTRIPYRFPTLRIKRKPASIFDYEIDDFEIIGYEHHPHIAAPVAV